MNDTETPPPAARIRDAATVLLVRQGAEGPAVLMGQRGATAAFMPSKFVFPGGAVDAGDGALPFAAPLNPLCAARLAEGGACPPVALAGAAIRELWEETGLALGLPGAWPGEVPADWQGFAGRGLVPRADALQFVFRAITPPGRPRRFDARFFLVHAEALAGDPDDFSAACEELSHLQWIPLPEARNFDLPFITEVVLGEVAARAHDRTPPASIPFFKNNDAENLFLRLNGTKLAQ